MKTEAEEAFMFTVSINSSSHRPHSIFTAVKAFTEEDGGVVIMPPVYAPFFMAAQRTGRKLIECSLNNSDGYYTIDFKKLEDIFKTGKAQALIFLQPAQSCGKSLEGMRA